MKKLMFLMLAGFVFIFASSAGAQVGPGMTYESENPELEVSEDAHGQSVDEVVKAILLSQGIESATDIDCTKASDDLYENLGDAWMDNQIGNDVIHERMDQMMGGEGSDSLREAHIQMGKNYLGCDGWGMGMMSMMFGLQNARGGLSPTLGGFGSGASILLVVIWLIALVDLVLLGVFLFKKIQKK